MAIPPIPSRKRQVDQEDTKKICEVRICEGCLQKEELSNKLYHESARPGRLELAHPHRQNKEIPLWHLECYGEWIRSVYPPSAVPVQVANGLWVAKSQRSDFGHGSVGVPPPANLKFRSIEDDWEPSDAQP